MRSKNDTGQFYALDLTAPSWETSNPPWKLITPNGLVPVSVATAAGHSVSVSQDHRTLTFWQTSAMITRKAVTNFNLVTNAWSDIPTPLMLSDALYNLPATTDPGTGMVYVPRGYNNSTMLVYSPTTGVATSQSMPPMILTDWFPSVWSTLRGTLMLIGGEGGFGSYFYEFKPPNGPWTEVVCMPP